MQLQTLTISKVVKNQKGDESKIFFRDGWRQGNQVKKPRPRDQSTRRRNSASLTRDTVEGARKRARVMALEIARQGVGGTGKAIRTWAIARYYVDVRDVSSIILIAEITAASTAPTALNPLFYPFPAYSHLETYTPDFLVCIFMSSPVINVLYPNYTVSGDF